MRYAELMKPLDYPALQLVDEMRLDPDVERTLTRFYVPLHLEPLT